MDEAEYSIPFILGASLADGGFGPQQMTVKKLSDPRILSQARKVRLRVNPGFDAEYPAMALAEIHVTTQNGRVFSSDCRRARGDWDDPLSDRQLEEKFILMVSNRIDAGRAKEIIKRIWSLESEPRMAGFLADVNRWVRDI